MKLLVVASTLLIPASALAHIHMTAPLSRTDLPTGDQKAEHCGTAGYDRNANPTRITTYLPGASVTITWTETIDHPGWFRIAFQPNGEIFGIPPAGNGPTGLGAPSNFPDQPQLGLDPINGSTVLVDRIIDGALGQVRTETITLPMEECTNCTLQFIQVMTDKAPYTIDALSDDIYFNCADIVISANAPAMPDAGPGAGPDAGTDEGGTSTVSGGCSTSGGTGSLAVGLGLLGLVTLRRRRR